TRLIHAAQPPDRPTGAVNPPVYLSTTFAQPGPGTDQEFVYGRTGNPTRRVLERALADLEGGRVGLAFSSGMGALSTLLENLPSGRRIVAVDDLYGGTWRMFEHHRRQFGLEVQYVDMTDLAAVESAVAGAPTAWVYAESPTNPLLRLVDLRAVARIA
ncbi:Cys/Met metabolism, pyridoxal phosphate-dependent enzyme, partial [mine drainage metagenome]